MSFVEEFIEDVKKECRTHSSCSKCKYYVDSVEECLFLENPEDWNIKSITHAYYYKFKEGEE